jgi:hypothetical protein
MLVHPAEHRWRVPDLVDAFRGSADRRVSLT